MTAEVSARKIADILERIGRVRSLLPPTPELFEANRTEAEALILNLYLALQGCSDLALHVLADHGVGVAADARAAYGLLADAGLVDRDLSRRLAAAVGLRNRIAHEYTRLDLGRVYAIARDELGDLEAFAAAMARATAPSGRS